MSGKQLLVVQQRQSVGSTAQLLLLLYIRINFLVCLCCFSQPSSYTKPLAPNPRLLQRTTTRVRLARAFCT